jgi:hypothetical protein
MEKGIILQGVRTAWLLPGKGQIMHEGEIIVIQMILEYDDRKEKEVDHTNIVTDHKEKLDLAFQVRGDKLVLIR